MIVDAAYKAGNVAAFVRANYKTSGSIFSRKKCHHAVSIVMFTILQVINISSIFSDYS